jgi:hypothetical protein
MAQQAATQIEKAPYSNALLQKRHALFLRNFAAKMTTLKTIAEKELAQQALVDKETKFLEDVVEMGHVRFGSGSKLGFVGWYPGLFYDGGEDSARWDALVADVHTDTPAPMFGDPGCVLHQAVGSVDLLLIAIDNGKDRMVYAGPVMSHFEFEMPRTLRKPDSEWKDDLRASRQPPRPEWTRGYLVPGLSKEVQKYLD